MALIGRRQFLIATGAMIAATLSDAQQTGVRRVGFLVAGSHASLGHLFEAMRQRLHELGYVEGQNLVIEARWADGEVARLSQLATELVRLKVDIIVAGGAPAVQAAQRASTVIPIIMGAVNDPVRLGFVSRLRRPGGNITGFGNMGDETSGKLVELAREVVPKAIRAAVLVSGDAASETKWNDAQKAGVALRLPLIRVQAASPDELERAFTQIVNEKTDALIVPADTFLNTQRKRIVELAAKSKLPAVYARREFAMDGGLVSYGLSLTEVFRRCADYVDQILKGAKPGDLPVELPAKFELVVNLKTAKLLGITIPRSLLLRAHDVIE